MNLDSSCATRSQSPMPYIVLSKLTAAVVLAAFLTGCGGGSSGGGGTPLPAPPPVGNVNITGAASLGIIRNAEVIISGTNGELGRGFTRSDGRFGPITISGNYSGPLLIKVRSPQSGGATWICDFIIGCPDGTGNLVAFGTTMPYTATLSAVTANARTQSSIQVSLLSHIAAEYALSLGNLSANNVLQANREVAALLQRAFNRLPASTPLTVPDNFNAIQLFDINSRVSPAGGDDRLAAALTLANTSMLGLMPIDATVDELADFVAAALSDTGAVSIGLRPGYLLSLEAALEVFIVHTILVADDGGQLALDIGNLLSPLTLDDLAFSAFEEYSSLPAIEPADANFPGLNIFVDDSNSSQLIQREIPIVTTGGGVLSPSDFVVTVIDPWVDAGVLTTGGSTILHLTFHADVLSTLNLDAYETFVNVASTTGSHRSFFVPITVSVDPTDQLADAGNDIVGLEREMIRLPGRSSRPGSLASVSWIQTAGAQATIVDPGRLDPVVILPSLAASEVLTFQLSVVDDDGNTGTDSLNVAVNVYISLSDVSLADAALEQCIVDQWATNGYEDAGEFASLDCDGVSDLTGLEQFPRLSDLRLANNNLTSLAQILALPDLQFLDLSGNPGLRCSEIEALEQTLVAGSTLIVDDSCRKAIEFELFGFGHDSVVDRVREQLYVSVPDRNEIAVISLTEHRIVDRLLLPGSPRGIDLSVDNSRLFVAMFATNSVAVIDVDQRSVRMINLGDKSGDARIWDVEEAEQDRLFVTSNPSSSGFAYVMQVRLDQGDIVSRVADGRIIRAAPKLVSSPVGDFLYVGEGFSPNSLYKLSLADPDAGIVLEDDHGSVGGTNILVLDTQGTRIVLGSGQVLRTGSFVEEGNIGTGFIARTELSDEVMRIGVDGIIEFADILSLQQLGSFDTGCALPGAATNLHAFDSDRSYIAMSVDRICIVDITSRTVPVDPYPELRFSDLALENCVRDAAQTFGFTSASEFIQLDCSGAAQSIRSLEGIGVLANLEMLDLSGSEVFDLGPIAQLSSLSSLAMRNTDIADVSPLLQLQSLAAFDVRGASRIECLDLDQLANMGVGIQADFCVQRLRVELGAFGQDLEVDLANGRAYVSVPALQAIHEIDLANFAIVNTIPTSGEPWGIELSADGSTIYTALNLQGSVGLVDTTTGAETVIDLNMLLDNSRTYDIAEYAPGRIVVSASPGSSGFAYIVQVLLDQGNAASRVANGRIIRAQPNFAVAPDGSAVFVGEGFSPNSLYRLDATDGAMPIVAEDGHGSVNGSYYIHVSPDGTQVLTAAGQIFDSTTITQVGQLPIGISLYLSDASAIIIADGDPETMGVYDPVNLSKIGQRNWGCTLSAVSRLGESIGGEIVAMGDDLLCVSRTVAY